MQGKEEGGVRLEAVAAPTQGRALPGIPIT